MHVYSLPLAGPTLILSNIPMSIVHLNQIKELYITRIQNISNGGIYFLLEHLSRSILEDRISLFLPSLHIYSFTIEQWKSESDLNLFFRMFSHVKSSQIDIASIAMMIELLNRLNYLEHVLFWYKFEKHAPYITIKWL